MTNVTAKREFEIIENVLAGQTDPCELYLVIHHQERAQILVSKHDLKLPCIRVRPWRQFPFVKTILWIPEVINRFGLHFGLTFVRCIWYKGHGWKDEGYLFQAVLVLDSYGDITEAPLDAKWEDLSRLRVPHPDADDAIQAFITESRRSTQLPLRPFYARQGWFRETRNWMEAQLKKNGFGDIREVNQIRHTYRGTVIRANTNRGLVYLKCSPFFVNEALINEKISRLLPEHVEEAIAVDVHKRLLLMRDYGEIISPLSMDDTESKQWPQELAEIHQATIGKKHVLQEAQLKLISVEMLPAKLEDLLNFVQTSKVVSTDILEQYKQLWPQIRRDCRIVEQIGIPMTFIHGDIVTDNVYRPAVPGGHHGMIDWAESAISHPFFDVVYTNYPDAYLTSWQNFLSSAKPESSGSLGLNRLFDCLDLCRRLRPLFSMIKLYLESFEVEAQMPVEMRTDLEGNMKLLVRLYARNG